MSAHPHFALGQWNAVCDRCGKTFKSRELRLEWTKLRVCESCFDKRHPQDFVRGKKDDQTPAWVRPEPEPVFVVPGPPDWDSLG